MSDISISKLIYKYFDDITDTETRQNIIHYMSIHNISNKGIIRKTRHKIKFKNQLGGTEYDIKLQDGLTYYYYINDIESVSKTKYKMWLVTVDNINECACLTFGKKESNDNIMRIDGLKSFDNCVRCIDPKHKFKSGDILMQIILELVKNNKEFTHIKKIELSDNSMKQCYDINLKLVYLRTMTHGSPYYSKFNFRPMTNKDYQVFNYNRNIFKLNKTITKKELLKIIKDNKIDMSDITYSQYLKYVKPYILNNDNINPKTFFIDLIKLIDDYIKNNNNNNNNKKVLSGICDFISKIYIDVFTFLGYKNYKENLWVLYIDK